MLDEQSADLVPLFSREQAENAFRDALNLFVGRGRRHKASEVCVATGVPRRILDCYRSYPVGHIDHRPLDFGQKYSLLAFIGADMTTAMLKLAGQGAYNLPDDEPDPGLLAADLSENNAKVARMAVDRDFGNDCPNEMTKTGTSLMSQGAVMVSLAARRQKRAGT